VVCRSIILVERDAADRECEPAIRHDSPRLCGRKVRRKRARRERVRKGLSYGPSRQARSTGGTPVRGTLSRRKAGLLAHGSTRWLRPSQVPCGNPVTRNGAATRRLQLRGQRRILSRKTPPASRLSPIAMPGMGNLDAVVQHHQPIAVNKDIKISLYAGWWWSQHRPTDMR
jgi:hypothetical protein